MNTKDKLRCKSSAVIIKAQAHPTRFFILEELVKRERCVCELTDMVGADISTVSKHLAIMRSAGLVAFERDGTRVLYRLKHPCARDFAGLAACIIRLETRNMEAFGASGGTRVSVSTKKAREPCC